MLQPDKENPYWWGARKDDVNLPLKSQAVCFRCFFLKRIKSSSRGADLEFTIQLIDFLISRHFFGSANCRLPAGWLDGNCLPYQCLPCRINVPSVHKNWLLTVQRVQWMAVQRRREKKKDLGESICVMWCGKCHPETENTHTKILTLISPKACRQQHSFTRTTQCHSQCVRQCGNGRQYVWHQCGTSAGAQSLLSQ